MPKTATPVADVRTVIVDTYASQATRHAALNIFADIESAVDGEFTYTKANRECVVQIGRALLLAKESEAQTVHRAAAIVYRAITVLA